MVNFKLLVVGAALAVCNLAARARREEQVAGEWQEYMCWQGSAREGGYRRPRP